MQQSRKSVMENYILLKYTKLGLNKLRQIINQKNIVLLFCFILICNGCYWLLEVFLHSSRYYVVIDYFLIIPFFYFKRLRWVALLIFSIIYFADLLYWIRQFYPYNNLQDFIELLSFIPYSPKIYWLFLFSFLFLFFISLISLFFLSKKIYLNRRFLIFYLLSGVFFFQYYDYRGVDFSDHLKTVGYWGSILSTYNNLKFNSVLIAYNADGVSFSAIEKPSAFYYKLSEVNSKKIIFILNESWGYNSRYHNFLINDYIKSGSLIEIIEMGRINSDSSTILAEIRELCNLTATGINFNKSNLSKLKNCVPNILKTKGYKTYSFHGADKHMYGRYSWYPSLGIMNSKFYMDLENKQRCSSFPGGCDKNILIEISNLVKRNESQFIYWLTLNTHHPYSKNDLDIYYLNCKNSEFKGRQEFCRNLNLQKQFFNNLFNYLKRGEFSGVEFFIVGDHPPPLIMDEVKKNYVENQVPYIHFKVN